MNDGTHDPTDVSDENDVADRAAIVKQNLPFLDDETTALAATDELHPGKINPASRSVDNARARDAQADDTSR